MRRRAGIFSSMAGNSAKVIWPHHHCRFNEAGRCGVGKAWPEVSWRISV
ncbi:msl1520 [Mesorhizobium japonicum MAFF 303099]|uniref:Msl1520 protein n=1 Tax=Mesorhizobium japonicum (strain LMG 29417 / CECT 9101 / MAFF 303099) TaxID=266835 RepID=Q98KE0_RHILO|nr:msl1520 [Mesorhizobium japonicum MAFF 303099]